MYFRNTIEGLDEGPAEGVIVASTEDEILDDKHQTTTKTNSASGSSTSERQNYPKPRTYVQKLALFRNVPGRPSVKQMFIMMYRPLLMFFYFPTVDWSGFLYGINLSWYVLDLQKMYVS